MLKLSYLIGKIPASEEQLSWKEFFSEAYLGEVNMNIIVEAGNTKPFSRSGRVAHINLL